MTYANIEGPMSRAMAGLSERITVGMKMAGMGAAAGGIGGLLQLVLGETLDQIVQILQSIVKILLMLSPIGWMIKFISDVLGAFWRAFQGVTKVWDMIMTSITKMVEPFANLLIPLLLPFLYLFTTLGRIMNIMLLPVFTALMKAFSQTGSSVSKGAEQILKGDLMGGIMTILQGMGKAFGAIKEQLLNVLSPLFDMLAKWLIGFLTIDIETIREVLEKMLGTQLGDAVFGFVKILYMAVSAVAGFISQLVGKETFDKLFGEGKFENISETNKAFGTGTKIASILQGIIGELGKLFDALVMHPAGDLWSGFSNAISGIINALVGTGNLKSMGMSISWDKLTTEQKKTVSYLEALQVGGMPAVFEKLALVVQEFIDNGIKAILAAIINFLANQWATMVTNIGNWATQIGTWYDQIKGTNFLDLATGIIKSLVSDWIAAHPPTVPSHSEISNIAAQTAGGSNQVIEPYKPGPGPYSDFILRPGAQPVAFSSGDTITGTKSGSGGSTVNNYYINSNSDRQTVDLIKKTIEEVNSRTSRYGYFQQGR